VDSLGKTVEIEVEGGVVVAVRGLPQGWKVKIIDHDEPD
jgi:hypothetical protein